MELYFKMAICINISLGISLSRLLSAFAFIETGKYLARYIFQFSIWMQDKQVIANLFFLLFHLKLAITSLSFIQIEKLISSASPQRVLGGERVM